MGDTASALAVEVPKGSATCKVSIINTTCDITVPASSLVEPEIPGHNWLNLPTYGFLLSHSETGAQVLFDAGSRKDWQNLVPCQYNSVDQFVNGFRVQHDVVDILRDGGTDVPKLRTFILSHHHFDHTGNISLLNPSTDLVVGPGFKDAFLPGYPTNPDSEFWEADFEGRRVVEVEFGDDYKLGGFQAFDYFGDGSLIILNVPGHAIGHIAVLVKTSSDTAVLLGGDTCHFPGTVRPSKFVPFPDYLPSATLLDRHIPIPCPCSIFTACHPDQETSRTTPFYLPSSKANSWYRDPKTSHASVKSLAEFDSNPNILLIIAHDPAPLEIMNFFPNGDINDWRAKNWKDAVHWHFVNELPIDEKIHRDVLVDGQYQNGEKLKLLDGTKCDRS